MCVSEARMLCRAWACDQMRFSQATPQLDYFETFGESKVSLAFENFVNILSLSIRFKRDIRCLASDAMPSLLFFSYAHTLAKQWKIGKTNISTIIRHWRLCYQQNMFNFYAHFCSKQQIMTKNEHTQNFRFSSLSLSSLYRSISLQL